MQEKLSQRSESLVTNEKSVISEAINRVLVDPSNPLESICHYEIKTDEEEQIWLAAIKGKHNPEYILEFKVFSTKPGNDEVRILGWIDLKNSVITDENGRTLSQEQLQNLDDCIRQFPENDYSVSESPSVPEVSTSELMP